jgi:hypothetical protein
MTGFTVLKKIICFSVLSLNWKYELIYALNYIGHLLMHRSFWKFNLVNWVFDPFFDEKILQNDFLKENEWLDI